MDYVVGVPRGFFSNTLVLPDKRFAEDKVVRELDDAEKNLKPGEFKVLPALSFRGRNLAQAVLPRTDLRRSDFTGANLDGANFESASLQKSRFGCADGARKKKPNAAVDSDDDGDDDSDSLGCAQLNRTRLDSAHLQMSDLRAAELQGASLFLCELDGALLDHVNASGAVFQGARLTAASLDSAKLRGASFTNARLYNADFSNAELQGATLSRALADGAVFEGANLKGATLTRARLTSASFESADIQGALFQGSRLYGAEFGSANLRLASFEGAQLWKVVSSPESVEYVKLDDSDAMTPPYEAGQFNVWRDGVLKNVADAKIWEELNAKFAKLGPQTRSEKLSANNETWPPGPVKKRLAGKLPTAEAQEEEQKRVAAERQGELAKLMAELVCDAKGAPFVARRLILNRRLAEAGPGLKEIANRLQAANPKDCPGGVGLTGSDLSFLQEAGQQAVAVSRLEELDPRRLTSAAQAFEWFEGNFQDYEKDKMRRLGQDSIIPHRVKYKKLTR